MWHHDVTNARTCQFFRRLFDRLPFGTSTSDLHNRILRKKIFHIRAYDFGVQFSFNYTQANILITQANILITQANILISQANILISQANIFLLPKPTYSYYPGQHSYYPGKHSYYPGQHSYQVGSANFSQRKIWHAHDNSADSENVAGAPRRSVHAQFIFRLENGPGNQSFFLSTTKIQLKRVNHKLRRRTIDAP